MHTYLPFAGCHIAMDKIDQLYHVRNAALSFTVQLSAGRRDESSASGADS